MSHDSGYLNISAVILLVLETPRAQRETTVATINRLTVTMTPSFLNTLIVMV